jgi:predicted metal-binding membrane protein
MHKSGTLTGVERSVRRGSKQVVAMLVILVAVAAVYTIAGVGMDMSALEMTFGRKLGDASSMDGMILDAQGSWGGAKVALVFSMWWLMMIAMMLPSAAPMILLFTALLQRLPTETSPWVRAVAFMAGYLSTWAVFSLIATGLQWWFEAAGLFSQSEMALTKGVAAPLLLVASGAYQFLPIKDRCLTQCRTPADFIARHHRPGVLGAAQTGALHGAYCLGCCFALMILLFVGGIMNLYWIILLSVLAALEKCAPHGRLVGRMVGTGLFGLGIVRLGLVASQ